jgi:hypothetical protein
VLPCLIRHGRYRPGVVSTTSEPPCATAGGPAPAGAPDPATAGPAATNTQVSDLWPGPGPRLSRRLRFGRPGPKSFLQELQAAHGRPRRHLIVPERVTQLELPGLLPGDRWPDGNADDDDWAALYSPDGHRIALGDTPQDLARAMTQVRIGLRLARTPLFHRGAGVVVSTTFLGVNHGGYPPTLWETILFPADRHGLDLDDRGVWRYQSANAARAGHARIVGELRAGFAEQRAPVRARRQPARTPGTARLRARYGLRHGLT